MKGLKYITLLLFSAVLLLASCKANSYAENRKKEKAKLSSFISNNNLIIKEGVNDSLELIKIDGPWPEKVYYKTFRGAYVRIDAINLANRQPAIGNTIIMRWKTYDLDGNLTGDNTNPTESREGLQFVYTPGGIVPSQGWNDCMPFMRHDCQATYIIESPIGPQEQQQAVISLVVKVLDFTVTN